MILSIDRYESRLAAGPIATASSASSTWSASRSASEYTATVAMPRRRAVLMTRQAISPRLAIRIFLNMVVNLQGSEYAEVTTGTRPRRCP